jgi:hypothetical protein
MYDAECFTMIWVPSKSNDVVEAKCPTTTTGMFAWKSCGGEPCAVTKT